MPGPSDERSFLAAFAALSDLFDCWCTSFSLPALLLIADIIGFVGGWGFNISNQALLTFETSTGMYADLTSNQAGATPNAASRVGRSVVVFQNQVMALLL